MPLLQVRDFPQELYTTLSAAAKNDNRSIAQQTVFMLKKSLCIDADRDKARRASALASTQALHLFLPVTAQSPTDMLRQDRDRSQTWELPPLAGQPQHSGGAL